MQDRSSDMPNNSYHTQTTSLKIIDSFLSGTDELGTTEVVDIGQTLQLILREKLLQVPFQG